MVLSASKGATLIDTVVATGLLLVVFVGINAAFRLTVDVVTNNKARAGAITLANERIEYIRSLPYDSIGTSGGIPAGGILQSESVTMNGIAYTRRTLIAYADDPMDGSGGADQNAITTDYKAVKVEVVWSAKNGTPRAVTLVTRISPVSVEQVVPGGVLSLSVIDAGFQPVVGAQVSIINTSTDPPINTTLFSDENGRVTIVGAPASAGYEITVSKSGFSGARTYAATAINTNPSPGHLTVALNQTTSETFAIDLVATKNVRSFTPVERRSVEDTFATAAGIADLSDTAILSGSIVLSGTPGEYVPAGTVRSIAVATATPITAWGEFTWNDWQPAQTGIVYRVYDGTGASLVPDSQVPGNAAGLSSSPVDLSLVSTSTYQSLSIEASLTSVDPNETPTVDSWAVSFDTGPIPYPNLTFGLRGTKTIGSGPSGQILLYSTSTLSTGPSAGVNVANLEWDSYTVTVDASTGYDIASICAPQPESISPGEYQGTDIILEPHTPHSLLIDVKNLTGTIIPGASVRVYRAGVDRAEVADACGQVFFEGLPEGVPGNNPYSVQVTAPGYAAFDATGISVSGTTRYSVVLN